MTPSGDTLALSSIEFDLTKEQEGQQVVVKWRSKPVFVRYRTPKEIAEAFAVPLSELRDPATDESRHKPGKAQWLILIGVCTHLGCVPNFGQGDYGGWFCPCHGSQYDTSGRIRKGPAPKNLYLPDYTFLSDTKVKIGCHQDRRTFVFRAEIGFRALARPPPADHPVRRRLHDGADAQEP